jgi:hypothetical protein
MDTVGRAIVMLLSFFFTGLITLSAGLSMSSTPSSSHHETATATTSIMKPRILCLHGKFQSGAIFSNKIGGARRKLARAYDLDFLDAPIVLPSRQNQSQSQSESSSSSETVEVQQQQQLAWWIRNEANENVKVQEALNYVLEYASGKSQTEYSTMM